MKLKLIFLAILTTTLISCQQSSNSTITKSDIKTQQDSVSYAIGLNIGKNLHAQKIEFSPEILLQGLKDGENDSLALLTQKEVNVVMMNFQKRLLAKKQEKDKELAEKNKKAGEEFLAKNKTKPGVVTLPNGLQYKILKSGHGKSPKITDQVVVNYEGKLINGTIFDSSYKRNKPFTTKLTGVIKGWTEILQKMKEGDKWEVYIPSELAYGSRGPRSIGPNSTLIFDIELQKVK